MVGAMALATKDVRPYHVNVGIPAKSIRVKPSAPPEAYVTERVARRYDTLSPAVLNVVHTIARTAEQVGRLGDTTDLGESRNG